MSEKGKNREGVIYSKSTRSNFGKTGWLFIIVGIIVNFVGAGSLNDGLNVIVPQFAEMYGWDSATMLAIATPATIIGMVATFFVSMYIVKKGYRYMLAITLIGTGVMLMIEGRITQLWQYILVYILLNLFINASIYACMHPAITNYFPTKKGLVVGWISMGANFSSAGYCIILLAIAGVIGFRRSFDFYAIIMFVMGVVCFFLIRDNPEDIGYFPDNDQTMTMEEVERLNELGKEYEKTSPFTIKKLLQTKQVWQIGIGMGGILLITVGIMSQIVPRLESIGYTEDQALNMMVVAALIGLLGSFAWGKLDVKIGTKKTVLIFIVWTIVTLAVNLIPNTVASWIGLIMIGSFIGGGNNLSTSVTGTVFGRYDFKRAWAVILPINTFVRAFGFMVVGSLASFMGGDFTVSFILCIVVAFVSLILIWTLDDKCIGRIDLIGEK